jgi:phospho-N-acetylmuramoyl-pentapeptide-transferase
MEHLSILTADLQRVLAYLFVAVTVGFIGAPLLTDFLYKNRIGKRLRQHGVDGKETPIFSKLHGSKAGTPIMGGLLFWVVTAVITVLFNLNRAETWLPLFALVLAGGIGAIDDLMNVAGKGHNGGGLRFLHKFWLYAAIAAVGAWWFYRKLGIDTIYIPGDLHLLGHSLLTYGNKTVGGSYPLIFIATLIFFSFSLNQTDGLDGLAGGVSGIALFAFTLIALAEGKAHLAVFCATLLGSLLAFLWFNINPARFFMGDTGSMALGMVLPVLAFLTNSEVVLPLILIIPFGEGLSTIIQIISKKFFHRKVFLVAPIHHHFEALGWTEAKVTMRFWVIEAIGASLGLLFMLATH